MNNNHRSLLAATALLTCLGSYQKASAAPADQTALLTFSNTYPGFGTNPPPGFNQVYNLTRVTALTTNQFNSLVRLAFGTDTSVLKNTSTIGSTRFVTSPNKKDPTTFFSLDLSNGAISFSRSLKKYEGDFASVLPDKQTAIGIAQNYLKTNSLLDPAKLSRNDTMVAAPELVTTVAAARPSFRPLRQKGITPTFSSLTDNTVPPFAIQPIGPFDKLRSVTITRKIANIPVVGPGSKAVVTIGDQNAVEGAIVRWRPFIQPTATSAIALSNTITPEQAYNSIKDRLKKQWPEVGTNPKPTLSNSKIPTAVPTSSPDDGGEIDGMIKQMDIAFYDSNDKAIQPVYVFVIENQRPPTDGSNGNFDFVEGSDQEERFLTFVPYLKKPPELIYQLGDLPDGTMPKESDEQP